MSNSNIQSWGLEQIAARGWEDYLWVGIISVGVGFAIGWLAGIAKTRAEIAKTRAEARKTAGENIKELSRMRDIVNSERETLNIAQQNMRDALLGNQGVEQLRLCRDEMCNVYENKYLAAANSYIELIPELVDEKEQLIRAKSELIPGLQSISGFLNLVNMEGMLNKIPSSQPYKTNRARRDGHFLRVKALVPWWCVRLKWKINRIQKQTDQHVRN